MPPDSILEHQFSKISWGCMSPDLPSMQCTLHLHIVLTTLTQNLPDQSKFVSYTPVKAVLSAYIVAKDILAIFHW